MRSNPYKPDDWENPLLHIAPSLYADSFVHWIGLVKEVMINDSLGVSAISFTLEQKYWDYIEDYSIQDEVMFVSPPGEGDFILQVPQILLTEEDKEVLKKMAEEKKLFFCYGRLKEMLLSKKANSNWWILKC
jgi:hypothetical protein